MKLVVLISLLFSFHVKGQNIDSMKWSATTKLGFADFLGAPDVNDEFSASCSARINYDYNIDYDTLNYDIFSYFRRNRSWMKIADSTLLAHEQLHFDIAEINSRMIKKRFAALAGKQIGDSAINKIIWEEWANSMTLDSVFDEQTSHGALGAESNRWSEKIKKKARLTQ